MKHLAMIVCVCAFALAPLAASAQTSSLRPQTSAQDDCAKAKRAGRTCQITFEDGDSIDGNRAAGSRDHIRGRSELVFSNLIKVRQSFRPEIIYAAEDL
ncbi:MAG: hypothetical protein Tsb0020_26630 [Haliangiales bacterium]